MQHESALSGTGLALGWEQVGSRTAYAQQPQLGCRSFCSYPHYYILARQREKFGTIHTFLSQTAVGGVRKTLDIFGFSSVGGWCCYHSHTCASRLAGEWGTQQWCLPMPPCQGTFPPFPAPPADAFRFANDTPSHIASALLTLLFH